MVREIGRVVAHLVGSSQSFSKRGSPRNGSKAGPSRRIAGVTGAPKSPSVGADNKRSRLVMAVHGEPDETAGAFLVCLVERLERELRVPRARRAASREVSPPRNQKGLSDNTLSVIGRCN